MASSLKSQFFSYCLRFEAVFYLFFSFLFFVFLYGLEPLDPQAVDWLLIGPTDGERLVDRSQHYLGWLFYRHSSASWPLGELDGFVEPLQAFLAYTDSVTWLALFLKPFSDLMPKDFQYSGYWLLSSYLLQSLFAYLILAKLNLKPAARAAGVFFLVTSPCLLYRTMHISLSAHWFLLVAIYLYLLTPSWRIYLAWLVVNVLSFLSHPYLGTMAFPIFLAYLVKNHLNAKTSPLVLSINFLLSLSFCLVCLYLFGYFNIPGGDVGFHFWGGDVFSFFNSFDRSLLPGFKSKMGQIEGFSFLGVGPIILLLLIIVKRQQNRFWRIFKDKAFGPLAVTVSLMFVYSLGSQVRFFSFWLIDLSWAYQPFEFITGSLRASGRYNWPLHYAFIIAVVVVFDRLKAKRAGLILAVLVVLTSIEQLPLWVDREERSYKSQWNVLTDKFWSQASKDYEHIVMVPPYYEGKPCGEKRAHSYASWVPLAWYAGQNNMSINSGYLARYPKNLESLCQSAIEAMTVGDLSPDRLYILARKTKQQLSNDVLQSLNCHIIDGLNVCVFDRSDH